MFPDSRFPIPDSRCITAVLLLVTPALAAAQAPCNGPGSAFGVTSYTCASCGIRTPPGGPVTSSFNSEPVIRELSPGSVLQAGDVIVSVDGKPITTREGAQAFSYPDSGVRVLRIRRDGNSLDLSATVTAGCRQARASDQTMQTMLPVAPRPNQSSVMTITGSIVSTHAVSRFGFAIGCLPSCTKITVRKGLALWRFDGYPPIRLLLQNGPAMRAGIKVGDQLIKVDGISILEEAGVLRLQESLKKETLHLTVLRDGKEIGYQLRVP